MIDNPVYVTKEKLGQMKEELRFLKTEKRIEVANRIEKAKELGDLSENAEYAEAKDEYSFTEGRVIELEDALRRAVIIESAGTDAVRLGSRVGVSIAGKEREFTVVGKTEADPLRGLVSNESPLGLALIGKRVGEEAVVNAPVGPVTYKIVKIE